MSRSVSVAVPVPGLGALTYLIPDGTPDPPVGARVLVPLGKRVVTGIVISVSVSVSGNGHGHGSGDGHGHGPRIRTTEVKPLIDVLDFEAFLPPSVVELAAWVAVYYACGAGEAIATAMPPRAWIESQRHARITEAGEARMLRERGARREILERLSGGRVASIAAVAKSVTRAHSVVASLQADGLVELTQPLKGAADASRSIRVAVLTAQGGGDLDSLPGVRLGARQEQALDLLRGAPEGIPLASFAREDIPTESLERLAARG